LPAEVDVASPKAYILSKKIIATVTVMTIMKMRLYIMHKNTAKTTAVKNVLAHSIRKRY